MQFYWGFPRGLVVRHCLPMQEMQETWVQPLGRGDLLEKETATYSSILAGKFHGPRSLVGYKELDMTEHTCTHTHTHNFIYKIIYVYDLYVSNNINYFKHTSLFFGHVTLQGRHDLWVVLLLKMITGQCFFPFYGYTTLRASGRKRIW